MTCSKGLRLDAWLHRVRFCGSRAIAAKTIRDGVRVNGVRTTRNSRMVHLGDQITFVHGNRVCMVRVRKLPDRRVSTQRANEMYVDLSFERTA